MDVDNNGITAEWPTITEIAAILSSDGTKGVSHWLLERQFRGHVIRGFHIISENILWM